MLMNQMDQFISLLKTSIVAILNIMPSLCLKPLVMLLHLPKVKDLYQRTKEPKRNRIAILHFGRHQNRVNQVGTRHGVKEDLDGILNALQWHQTSWENLWIFTLVVSI